MARARLTEEDVRKLLDNPSGETRADMAAKIGTEFRQGVLTEQERKLAEDIFRVMVKDAEVRVREALAQTLKDSLTVPKDVALSLAQDVNSVALPIIQYSEVLSDAELIEIIRGQDSEKQLAVAKRDLVSERVSDALVQTHNETAIETLVANDGAQLSEASLQTVVQEFGTSEGMQSALINRAKLPITVSERLVAMVSENMRSELAKRHALPEDMATDLILQAREQYNKLVPRAAGRRGRS